MAYFSLGSNLGNRESNLERARLHIIEKIGRHLSTSPIYETTPWGYGTEHLYLNCCTVVETVMEPLAILDEILSIEKGMGRRREAGRYTDRTIDIDLLFCGNRIIRDQRLIVPHPELGRRRFVLVPLNDIAPDLVHPVEGIKVSEMLARCQDHSPVRGL
jgi:2-amino-4-hydroxy-6-hydroxymethyldihydropteridine diphosphokinase